MKLHGKKLLGKGGVILIPRVTLYWYQILSIIYMWYRYYTPHNIGDFDVV